MHPRARLAAQLADRRHVLNHPGLVVGIHHRDDAGRLLQCDSNVVEVGLALRRGGKLPNLPAEPCEVLRRLRDARMFDGAHGDLGRLQIARGALDEQIVRFRAARREDDLRRLHSDQRGDLLTRDIHGFAGTRAELMPARGVAVVLPHERQHRFEHPLIQGRRRVIVEIHVCQGSLPSETAGCSTMPILPRPCRSFGACRERCSRRLPWRDGCPRAAAATPIRDSRRCGR